MTSRPMTTNTAPPTTRILPIEIETGAQEIRRILLLDEFHPDEEVPDFKRRCLRRVGSVRRVFTNRAREFFADGSRIGLRGIRRAHQCPPLFDGVWRFEYERDDGPGRHEFSESLEKGALPMNRVE